MSSGHMHTKSIPILVDNSLNKAMAIKYGIFALFGLVGIWFGIPSIQELWSNALATLTGGMVFLSASAASFAAWNTERGLPWWKAGIYSGYAFIFSASLYSAALIILAIQGDSRRVSGAVISAALVVMPIWYVRYLIRRVRGNQ